MRKLIAVLSVLAVTGLGLTAAAEVAPTASAAPVALAYGGSQAGNVALNWAEGHETGCWYAYGGSGPCGAGYDCSGAVMAAFAAAGIALPHSTYAMLGSPHLHWIPLSQARRGDLVFYGSGHVEIKTIWYHGSYGAQDTGTRVGWHTWSGWWEPTAAYRVW